MLTLHPLREALDIKTFARSNLSPAGRRHRLSIGLDEFTGQKYLIFDTANNEHGTGCISLETIKKIIDAELTPLVDSETTIQERSTMKLVGYLKKPLAIRGLGIFGEGHPVHELSDCYILELGSLILKRQKEVMKDCVTLREPLYLEIGTEDIKH